MHRYKLYPIKKEKASKNPEIFSKISGGCLLLPADIPESGPRFSDIYRGIDRKYWHNAILSIENGLFIYNAPISELPETLQKVYLHGDLLKIEDSIDIQYPQIIVKLPGKPESFNCSTKLIETKSTDIYAHIYLFLAFVKQAIDESFRYYIDSLEYLELGEKQRKIIKAESRDA